MSAVNNLISVPEHIALHQYLLMSNSTYDVQVSDITDTDAEHIARALKSNLFTANVDCITDMMHLTVGQYI